MDSILVHEEDTSKKVLGLLRYSGQNRYVPQTKKLINSAIQVSKANQDGLLLANSYYALGNYYFFNANIDSSLTSLDLADEYLGNKDPMLKASILSTRGGIYSKSGDVTLALSTQLEAKAILEQIDATQLEENAAAQLTGKKLVLYNSLANLYLKIDDYDNALKNYDEAYNLAVKDERALPNTAIILSNKGELLYKMKRYEEALETAHDAKKMKIRAKLPERFVAVSNYHIGRALYQLDSVDVALDYLNNALTQSLDNQYTHGEMLALAERGLIYLQQGNFENALKDCSRSLELAEAMNEIETKIEACDCLYKTQSKLGNFESSLKNFERYTQLKDSLFNEKNVRKITQLGMQYEFDKRDAEQELLIAKKNRQQKLILWGVGVLFVFGLLASIFFRKRLIYQKTITEQQQAIQEQEIVKLRQNNRITAMNSMIEGQEKERARIAKDLHDGLGSLLSSVKSHYIAVTENHTSNKETVDKTEQLIDYACNEVRRISHNMVPHTLAVSGLSDGIKDLADRLTIDNYEVTLDINKLPKLDATKEAMVYRLVQEIVSNIKKHAKAKSIFIQLYAHNDQVFLTVEDDGVGFDLYESKNKKGLGLKNIESRVAYLNGEIDWDSKQGKGTTININFTA
ncbi:tetratricopeptide repeat-containing sensor histidine kinase [Flagellimonas okinawensis]|uniref:histidine kinase n=1 Tax=Flagellimonas okinawensis TaxID=3031324 RepID=A0ABT5XJ40_9FLAO|nr:tetratricopeptide repeat protein [[Muricauda] okinawensis]MDF0705898.1 tetratricopeptide repeat protein [[Muricauda] okinawensis]